MSDSWEEAMIAVMDAYRREDPAGWAVYLAEVEEMTAADAPIEDGWNEDGSPR